MEFAQPVLGPSTNNAIEATNAHIKRQHTLRERLPVGQFLTLLFDILRDWSSRRNPKSTNYIPFTKTPPITLKLWTQAYQWAILNKAVIEEAGPHGGTHYYVGAGDTRISNKSLKVYKKKNGRWTTFDEFKKLNYGTWMIQIMEDEKKNECSCPHFLKIGQCKHVLGILIRLKKIVAPAEAKSVPLGQKRKRGRPSKAKSALLVQ